MNEKLHLIQMSLKFVPKGLIDNTSALVQVMAWHRIGDKPLPEPMLTHFTDAYMHTRKRWVNQLPLIIDSPNGDDDTLPEWAFSII